MTITADEAIDRLETMAGGYTKVKQAEALRMGAAALRRIKEIEDWTDTRLSDRARPGIEVPQWVNDEIKLLEVKVTSVEIPPSEATESTVNEREST